MDYPSYSAPALPPGVAAEAVERLRAISKEEGVRIFAAVESGSRAWGFPSPDSDYDVRFIYLRPVADYLRLDPVRDVIERPLDGLWDINGWDLRKALLLLARGNAVVVEWLRSPLVYLEEGDLAQRMRDLADRHGDVPASVRHYYGLLHGGWAREFGDSSRVRLKKYFYVIRAAAALAWLRRYGTTPPMALPDLIAGDVLPAAVGDEVAGLLAAKQIASEMGEGERRPVLDRFIVDHLDWAVETGAPRDARPPAELLTAVDALFREAVLRP